MLRIFKRGIVNKPKYYQKSARARYKKIPVSLINQIEGEIKALLHASRDTLRNHGENTSHIRFDSREAYYSEAFGIMRTLHIQNYGWFGSSNLNALQEEPLKAKQPINNLRWWFGKLEDEVLEEEDFKGNGRCEYCLKRYHQDTKS